MRNALTAAAVVAAAVLLAGCSVPAPVDAGVVVARQHTPARDWLMPTTVGKTTVMVPEHDDATWSVTVQDCRAPHPDAEACPEQTHRVARGVWERATLGAWLDVASGRVTYGGRA